METEDLFTEYQGHVSNIKFACLSQSSGFKSPGGGAEERAGKLRKETELL